jgi:hypothetical protein
VGEAATPGSKRHAQAQTPGEAGQFEVVDAHWWFLNAESDSEDDER